MRRERKLLALRLCRAAPWWFLAIAVMLPYGAAAIGLANVDQSLAQAVAVPLRGNASLSEIVRRALAEAQSDDALQDSLAQREAIAAALDQIARSGDGPLDVVQAGLLVDVLQTLDAAREFEKRRGRENALSALTTAIWRRYVAPAVAEMAAARRVPLAPRAAGELAGQWLDAKGNVRAFDLWADERTRTLAWSRTDFATPVPDGGKLIERGIAGPPPRQGAKLALYVDLSALQSANRATILSLAEGGAGTRLAFVFDDVKSRIAECLAAEGERKPRTEAAPKPKRAGGPAEERKAGAADEEGPDARAQAEARCRSRVTVPGAGGEAILFDPKRRIKVLSLDLTNPKRTVDQAAAIAQVWP